MTWRTVVIANKAKLELKMNYMIVRSEDDFVKVHLSEIGVLIIENTAVSITASLLVELIENKIKVIFCDAKRNPSFELIPYYGCHDSSDKIRTQISWDRKTVEKVWTEIVREKINQQAKVLEELGKEEAGLLKNYINEIQNNDITNREGHAAKVYFNALFGKAFSRENDDASNAALNYGYTVILSAFNREITSNGYLTQIGLFHDNKFNPFNLGSDLMEPFRPLVDRKILKMELKDELSTDNKRKIVDILNSYVRIGDKKQTVANAIKIYTKSVFDAIQNNDVSQIKFYVYEE